GANPFDLAAAVDPERELEAQVDHLGLVGGREANALRDVARGPEALRVEHANRHDFRSRRGAERGGAVAGSLPDRAGQVRAVTVLIEGLLVLVDEVIAGEELAAVEVRAAAEPGLLGDVRDPGVQNRHPRALALGSAALLEDVPRLRGVETASLLELKGSGGLRAHTAAGEEVPLRPL